jgi:aryl-alcohol dehydrogenase-like predicted oxidoreductase
MLVGIHPFLIRGAPAFGKPVCRLGLASHSGATITAADVLFALERGVNFLNWAGAADSPGTADAFTEAIGSLGPRRDAVIVCVQFGARTVAEASAELRSLLATLRTDHIDILTLYYVERPEEWQQLRGPGGVLEYLRAAREDGVVRRIGITSHQRQLAAEMARSGLLDALMIRYNAAHRGAQREVFPVTEALGLPVIAYTALRWGALLRATPDDPSGFTVPAAPYWYRFVLQAPAVAVTLAAPHSRAELLQDLEVLQATGPLPPGEYEQLARHGERVRRHGGRFP